MPTAGRLLNLLLDKHITLWGSDMTYCALFQRSIASFTIFLCPAQGSKEVRTVVAKSEYRASTKPPLHRLWALVSPEKALLTYGCT